MNERDKALRDTLREEWLLALEGKLENKTLRQATGALCSSMLPLGAWGYCCLGVACEVYRRHRPIKVTLSEGGKARRAVAYNGSVDFLPGAVGRAFGFKGINPQVEWSTLAYKNDSRVPFATVAAKIRSGEWKVWEEEED